MQPQRLSPVTLDSVRKLLESNYAGRDELYAAVETLDDGDRRDVCRRLAEHLAGHAAELEQILMANGDERFDHSKMEFIDHLSERVFFEMVKDFHGESRVLDALEQCEKNLKEKYDRLLKATSAAEPAAEMQGVLERQRKEVAFGEQVLHTMHRAANDPPGSPQPNDE